MILFQRNVPARARVTHSPDNDYQFSPGLFFHIRYIQYILIQVGGKEQRGGASDVFECGKNCRTKESRG